MALERVLCPRCGHENQVGIPKDTEIVDISRGPTSLPGKLLSNKGHKEVWCDGESGTLSGRHSFTVIYE